MRISSCVYLKCQCDYFSAYVWQILVRRHSHVSSPDQACKCVRVQSFWEEIAIYRTESYPPMMFDLKQKKQKERRKAVRQIEPCGHHSAGGLHACTQADNEGWKEMRECPFFCSGSKLFQFPKHFVWCSCHEAHSCVQCQCKEQCARYEWRVCCISKKKLAKKKMKYVFQLPVNP